MDSSPGARLRLAGQLLFATDIDRPLIVGKDNHRHAWVRELVDLARERRQSTLVVDMGWPSEDRRYADVATLGASRYMGRALAAWLEKAEQQ